MGGFGALGLAILQFFICYLYNHRDLAGGGGVGTHMLVHEYVCMRLLSAAGLGFRVLRV